MELFVAVIDRFFFWFVGFICGGFFVFLMQKKANLKYNKDLKKQRNSNK